MGQTGEWVPGNAPLDEAYWEALLSDGEDACVGQWVVPDTAQELRDGTGLGVYETPAPVETTVAENPWQDARSCMERGEVLKLPVVGCNRGGVLVGWNGLRGFVPASHLVNLPSFVDGAERYGELRRLVGSQLCLKIIELEPELQRFVLSERASRLDESHRQDVLDHLCPGDICQGRVTNLCSFGAFVDLGGVEGLVHVSELSWGRVEHPTDVLKPGQPVEVYVLNVDRERGRVGLSVKRLQPDPWHSVEQRYQIGQVVEGTVTHVVNFGAFVRVEDGLEGLIHVSELAGCRLQGNFIDSHDVVREGEVVTARVINIDSERRRMGLSIRQAEEADDYIRFVENGQTGEEGTAAPYPLADYPH